MPLSALLSYRRRLVDAEREEDAAVTSASRLVALHQPILSSEEGTLIKNLTQIARLANENECILISEDETVMPPADAGGYQAKLRHRYIFVATFNRLVCSHYNTRLSAFSLITLSAHRACLASRMQVSSSASLEWRRMLQGRIRIPFQRCAHSRYSRLLRARECHLARHAPRRNQIHVFWCHL